MSFKINKHIRYRIIVPFVLLFTVASIVTWGSYAYMITRYIDGNIQNQMNQIVDIISGSGYTLNSNILIKLKKIINAEIIFTDSRGNVIQSTIPTPASMPPSEDNVMKDIVSGDVKYRSISKSLNLSGYGKSYISLWVSAREINQIKTKIVFIMGLVSLLGVFAMGVIGFFIAKSITSPVENFVEAIKGIDSGESGKRVEIDSKDEIGLLAEAFNNMIDRVKDSEKKLVESEKMSAAGQIAAGFAHEIKNPLTGIKMMAQILHRRLKGQNENQEVLISFLKEIGRLDHIINEIINRARPTDLNRSWGNINHGIQEVLDLVTEGYAENGIDINLNLSGNLPDIYIDHDKIKQVLWNLILNSREAMPLGGVMDIFTGFKGEKEIEVSVRDTGHGIKQEDLDLLFKPFYTSKPEGVGLGLTTSRKIIEKHGGKLFLRNRTKGGAEAVFCLPINMNEDVND